MTSTIELLPEVEGNFDAPYLNTVVQLLRRLFPSLEAQGVQWSEALKQMSGELPLIRMSEIKKVPGHLSVYFLSPQRANAAKFFYDMIHQWLLPGRRLKIELFFSADFCFSCEKDQIYSLAEIVIPIKSWEESQLIKRHFSLIAREIGMGVGSVYQANRILEMKGLTVNQKTGLIQERLSAILAKMPHHYDTDLLLQMQKFLVSTTEIFRSMRPYSSLARMIYLIYLLQSDIKMRREHAPDVRHMRIKTIPISLQHPLGNRHALGIFVCFNFLRDIEVFQKKHLMRALGQCDRSIEMIEDSFLIFERKEDRTITLYMEIEKNRGQSFTLKERMHLQTDLSHCIIANIERPLRAVFMPRNEEEVMRNIVILSHELKYMRDLPQVIISFNEQKEDCLFFTLIVVRLLKPEMMPLEELLKGHTLFKVDRVRKVGLLRKKISKIATVLTATVSNTPFLRPDFTLNLYEARLYLLSELQKVIGEVRDFNGGMISKQNELFLSLQESLGEMGETDRLLLENFFHSIFPIELRSILRTEPLKTLFLLVKEQLGKTDCREHRDEKHTYILIGLKNPMQSERILQAVSKIPIGRLQLARLQLPYFEINYLGFILFSNESEKIEALKACLQMGLNDV